MADTGRARQLCKDETWTEKLLWRWLRGRRFSNYKFRRQHPEGIYYLDFFCEAARLSVELDGFGHGHPDQQRHDAERKAFLTSARHQGTALLEFQFATQRAEHSGHNFSRVTGTCAASAAGLHASDGFEEEGRLNVLPHPGLLPKEKENRFPSH